MTSEYAKAKLTHAATINEEVECFEMYLRLATAADTDDHRGQALCQSIADEFKGRFAKFTLPSGSPSEPERGLTDELLLRACRAATKAFDPDTSDVGETDDDVPPKCLAAMRSVLRPALEAQRAEGRKEALRDIYRLPLDPIMFMYGGVSGPYKRQVGIGGDHWQETWKRCAWCRAEWDRHLFGQRDGKPLNTDYRWAAHPANGCLWHEVLSVKEPAPAVSSVAPTPEKEKDNRVHHPLCAWTQPTPIGVGTCSCERYALAPEPTFADATHVAPSPERAALLGAINAADVHRRRVRRSRRRIL